jgi:hypothetical protein
VVTELLNRLALMNRIIFTTFFGMAGRPRKKPGTKLDLELRIGLTGDHKERIQSAAESVGIEMSAWARLILLREADIVLAQKRKPKARS